jgi:oligosaccharide repeat unit polymerase
MLESIKSRVLLSLYIVPALIVAGLLPSVLLSLPDFHYPEARLAYGSLLIIAIGIIIFQLRIFGTDGIFSPLTWALLGFIYFLCLTPVLNPKYFFIYSQPQLFLPTFLAVLAGMISFIIGFFVALGTNWPSSSKWLSRPIFYSNLANIVIAFWGLYIAIVYYVARSSGYSFADFTSLNIYLLGDKARLIERFSGISFYLYLIMRQLPIALSVPSVSCLVSRTTPKYKSLMILPGLLLSIFFSINSGGRTILSYIVGGAGVYLMLRNIKIKNILNRRSIKYIGVFAAIFLLLFLVTSIQIQFRSEQSNASLVLRFDKLVQGVQKNVVNEVTDQNFTLYRVVAADHSGSLSYLWGESYTLTLVAMIPRSLWPGKPGGNDMYRKLDIVNPWHVNDNISHSFLGELIYNFTGWAVIPGALLFGAIAGLWWQIFRRYRGLARMQILYGMTVVPVAFMVRGTFHAMFGTLFYSLILAILVLVISDIRFRYRL